MLAELFFIFMFSEIPGELPERNKDGNKDIFIITDFFRNTRIFIVFISTEKESAQTYGVCPQPFQIQHPVRILEDRSGGIFPVRESNAHAQRNLRKAVIRLLQRFIGCIDLLLDGVAQITGHLHHDNGKIISTDPAHIVDASERIIKKLRYFLEDLVRLSCAESALSSVESYTSWISSRKDSSDLP